MAKIKKNVTTKVKAENKLEQDKKSADSSYWDDLFDYWQKQNFRDDSKKNQTQVETISDIKEFFQTVNVLLQLNNVECEQGNLFADIKKWKVDATSVGKTRKMKEEKNKKEENSSHKRADLYSSGEVQTDGKEKLDIKTEPLVEMGQPMKDFEKYYNKKFATLKTQITKGFKGLWDKVDTVYPKNGEENEVIHKEILSLKRQMEQLSSQISTEFREQNLQGQLGNITDTIKKLDSRISNIEEKNDKAHQDLTDKVVIIRDKLDGNIDLNDAKQVLQLRSEAERFVKSEIVLSISKKIIPIIEHLKDIVDGSDQELKESVNKLEDSCNNAGLLPIEKLF